MLSKSAGSLPCNWQQAYNASKQQKAHNPLYGLILDCKNLQGEEQFVYEIKLMLEPSITLAMDYQLADFEAFCTNSDHCSVLSVDPTFDLGSLMRLLHLAKIFSLSNEQETPQHLLDHF